MELTDIRIALRDEPRLKAFVTITFDDCFVVRGVKVIDGPSGLFVAMPSRRKTDGTYQDIAHPIHREMRERIESRVLAEYRGLLQQQQAALGPA
jgi:stage V sporulation protein G